MSVVLPKLSDLDVKGKRVIVRGDLDISLNEDSKDSSGDQNFRLAFLIETLKYLVEKKAKITIVGHRGRPEGKVDDSLSLEPVSKLLEKILNDNLPSELRRGLEMNVMENLRFDPREEKNDEGFVHELCQMADMWARIHHQEFHPDIIALKVMLENRVQDQSQPGNPGTSSVRLSPQVCVTATTPSIQHNEEKATYYGPNTADLHGTTPEELNLRLFGPTPPGRRMS